MSDLPQSEIPTLPSTPTRIASRAASDLAKQIQEERYQRAREIGRGGMGKILEAVDKPLRRSIALKLLVRRGDVASQNRFIREARITGALQHPSIVPVHELNVDETGELFYTMKLVRGMTLLEILQNLGRRDPETLRAYPSASLLTIFQKVCDAVAFAHSQPEPVIHRDLKPENIMVGDYGEVLVMDWGAAKVLHPEAEIGPDGAGPVDLIDHGEGDELSAEVFVTQAGNIMGTPGYMAPEQARGQTARMDERTDIYALGGILYALLTWVAPGRLTGEQAEAFEERSQNGEGVNQMFHQHVAPLLSDRSARQQLGHAVPDSLVAVVLKAMSFHPEDRFQSVKQIQVDVAAYQAGRATTAERAGAWKHFKLLIARNKVLFSSIASVFITLLAATGISLYERQAALKINRALQLTLHNASEADLDAARQRFRTGAWREGLALLARSLTFWPENREAANYLLSAIAFGQGDRDKLPIFGVYRAGPVRQAAFSPNGRYFATASIDGGTRVWDVKTGDQIGKTVLHTVCNMPVFSPDSRRLFSLRREILPTGNPFAGVFLLSDLQTGQTLVKPMWDGPPDIDHLTNIMQTFFSSDGKQLLTCSLDCTARVWDTASGKEIAQLTNPHNVSYAVWSPGETRILTVDCYGGAMLWDAKTFQQIGTPMKHGSTISKAVFTSDGNKIVTWNFEDTARIWDGHTGQPLSPPLRHKDFVQELDVSPDGKLFATACYDKNVRLWSLADGSAVGSPMTHEGPVNTLAFSPDAKRLVSASWDKTVRLWDVMTCKQIGNPLRHDGTVLRALFNPEGDKILSIGEDDVAYLWETNPPPWPGEVVPIPGKICSIEFTENEDCLFVATRDGKAGIWSLSKNEFVSPVANHRDPVSLAAFHSASKQFATAGSNGIIQFWNAETGQRIGETKKSHGTIMSLEYAADGHSVFVGYLGGYVWQWRIPEGPPMGQEIHAWENPGRTSIVEWATIHDGPQSSPKQDDAGGVSLSGNEVASGCRDNSLYLWKIHSATAAGHKIRHTNLVPAVTYSIVTVTIDGVARLWRIPSTSELPPKWLPEYLRALGGLSFSERQQLTQVSTRERLELRKKLLSQAPENTIWDTLMRWSFQ